MAELLPAPEQRVKPLIKMKLPEKIYLQIECEIETELKDLIVQLKVRSGRKNPYYIFFCLKQMKMENPF